MRPSDLSSVVELAQAATCCAVLEHLRMIWPEHAEQLHRVAWIAARCGLAGHGECELRVPAALAGEGEVFMAVRDILAELQMNGLLGLPPAAATEAEGGAAAPVNGKLARSQPEGDQTGPDGSAAG